MTLYKRVDNYQHLHPIPNYKHGQLWPLNAESCFSVWFYYTLVNIYLLKTKVWLVLKQELRTGFLSTQEMGQIATCSELWIVKAHFLPTRNQIIVFTPKKHTGKLKHVSPRLAANSRLKHVEEYSCYNFDSFFFLTSSKDWDEQSLNVLLSSVASIDKRGLFTLPSVWKGPRFTIYR